MTLLTALLLGLLLGLPGGLALGLLLGRRLVRRDEARLDDAFARVAHRALQAAGADSREAVGDLVGPLRDQLGRMESQLHGLEAERARALGELHRQVDVVRQSSQELGRETASLVDALRRPQARGQWGELQLRRVVEHAGMLERCDFLEQETLPAATSDADGRPQRPDLVVRLAGGRSIVVDAKVTLAAYLEAVQAGPGEAARAEERLAAHARHLRAHVDALAAKAYWRALPCSPEFVVLFVPGESFLGPALERDPGLLEHALAKRVHLATPTTLISLLRTAAYAWQQQALADDAQQVLRAGQELYHRLGTFGGHLDKLGRTLGGAVADYNRTVGSLERSLLPSARRMADLSAGDGELAAPRTLDGLPAGLAAPELTVVPDQPDRRYG